MLDYHTAYGMIGRHCNFNSTILKKNIIYTRAMGFDSLTDMG